MAVPLRILFVEDSLPDTEEILHILRNGGFAPNWQRVDELSELRAALTEDWDIILSDHQMPGFNSLDALEAWRKLACDVPFLIVSGVVDEEIAVLAMKSGASDFLKKDRLSRLVPAIKRELAERESRKTHMAIRKKLQDVEERFRLMVETAQDYAIFMLDPEGVIATWNIGAQWMFGYSPSEAIGLPLAALYPQDPSDQGDGAARALALALSTGHYEEEGLRARQDGSNFWVHTVMMPMLGDDGSLKGFSRITRDIDQKRRAEEALKQARLTADEQTRARKKVELEKAEVEVERANLKNLFHQTSAIIAMFSGPQHLIEFSNPSLARLLDHQKVNRTLVKAYEQLQKIVPLLDEVFCTGKTSQLSECSIQSLEGQHYYDFIFSAKRDCLGHIDGVMLLGTDVTEQMQARRAAEASNASKSAFLANMSHEIRTPLGAILGFSELIKEGSPTAHERDSYIDTINRNSQALTQIIDDILDLAKVEAGRLDVEEIELSIKELMDDVVRLFMEKARQKNIYLTLRVDSDVPNLIRSDPTRLRQILFNIIGNAIKFTEVGGVDIHVRITNKVAASLHFAVDIKDTGRGLSESQRQRLFQPFTQADNTTTRQFGGTGLGLALSMRLCEALGGSIEIGETTLGIGSVFTISFVASQTLNQTEAVVPPKSRSTAESNQAMLANLRILVVDDVPDNQFLLKRFLSKSGAIVDLACDGCEAVEKALALQHDVVLMDIQMPKMDGYQALRVLREGGYKKPIIALTAHALLEERRRTEAAGFVDHLTKPFNREELLQTVAFHTRIDAERSDFNAESSG